MFISDSNSVQVHIITNNAIKKPYFNIYNKLKNYGNSIHCLRAGGRQYK